MAEATGATGRDPVRMQVIAHLDRATAIRAAVFSGGTPPAPFAVVTIGASAGRVELLVNASEELRRLRVALEAVERELASSLAQWRVQQQSLGTAWDMHDDPHMNLPAVPASTLAGGGE